MYFGKRSARVHGLAALADQPRVHADPMYISRCVAEGSEFPDPMRQSVFTDAYTSVREALIALRKDAGVTQVELARRLGKPQQFASR